MSRAFLRNDMCSRLSNPSETGTARFLFAALGIFILDAAEEERDYALDDETRPGPVHFTPIGTIFQSPGYAASAQRRSHVGLGK
jgi:hypothetical protein